MQTALWLGYGLRGMATVYLVGVLLTEILRTLVAHRVCEGLEVRPRHVSREAALRMSAFGGKVFVGAIAGRLLYQTNNVILAKVMGPASLALYARALALVMIVGTFVGQARGHAHPHRQPDGGVRGRRRDCASCSSDTSRYCAYLALPPLVFLAISGGSVLKLWMGADYAAAAPVLTVLALGHLLTYVHRPMCVHPDRDRQTRPIGPRQPRRGAIASVVICVVTVKVWGMGLLGAAWAIALPLWLSSGLYIPAYGCRPARPALDALPSGDLVGPLLAVSTPRRSASISCPCSLPEPAGLLLGIVLGGALLAIVYWYRVVPPEPQEPAPASPRVDPPGRVGRRRRGVSPGAGAERVQPGPGEAAPPRVVRYWGSHFKSARQAQAASKALAQRHSPRLARHPRALRAAPRSFLDGADRRGRHRRGIPASRPPQFRLGLRAARARPLPRARSRTSSTATTSIRALSWERPGRGFPFGSGTSAPCSRPSRRCGRPGCGAGSLPR